MYSYLNTLFSEVYHYYGIHAPWYADMLVMIMITFLVWEGNRLIQKKLEHSLKQQGQIRFLFVFFFTGLLIAAVTTLALSYCTGLWLRLPPAELRIGLKLAFTYGTRINLFLHILNGIFVFIDQYKRKQLEAEELKRINAQAQLQAIKNQVNPHFLFNNLNVLSGMVMKDNPDANKFIEEFAKVYRYILNSQDKELIELQTELEFIKPYIFLLEKRFPDSISIQLNIDKKYFQYFIVPAALQMLVENAIKHNVLSKARPLQIMVNINAAEHLVVSNTLQPKTQIENSTQVGLNNITKRYELTTGQNTTIVKDELSFSVSLPLIQPPS